MLDQLVNLVKEHAGEAIIHNPAIPNEKNETAIHTTSQSIIDTLKAQVSAGKLESVLAMFKNADAGASAVTKAIQSQAAADLMKKIGIDQAQAGQVVASLLPQVMERFVHKTNDPNDHSLNLKDVIGSLGGDTGPGLLGNLKNLFN